MSQSLFRGIDLSTIGLGHDFNQDLLRELADAGRGSIHFVGSANDIKKTFIDELDSLLAPAARNVKLSFDFGSLVSQPELYGYDSFKNNQLRLDNLNCGATQVVLAKLKPTTDGIIKVQLKYVDSVSKEKVELSQSINVRLNEQQGYAIEDVELQKKLRNRQVGDRLPGRLEGPGCQQVREAKRCCKNK